MGETDRGWVGRLFCGSCQFWKCS